MRRNKNCLTKRICAIALAVTLLVGTLFTGVVCASATSLTDDLTHVATLSDNAVPFDNGWAPLSDIQGGGVNLKYLALSAGLQYVYNQNIAAVAGPFPGVQGFMLQFDGYVNNNTSAQTDSQASGIFTLVLTRSTADTIPHIKQGTPFIEFDTNNGTVKLGHGTSPTNPGVDVAYDQTIITSDTLKYANISNKPFTVEFLPNDEATVKVVVDVDGQKVEGLLTKSLLFAQTNAPTESSLYVSIGGLDNSNTASAKQNRWEINFYGFKNYAEGYVPPKITDGLTDIATLEKNAVPFTNGWAPLSDIQGGGVNLKYLALSAGLQYVYNQNIAAVAGAFPGVAGFMLQFDGYVNNNTSAQTDSQASGIFTLVLTRSTADTIPHIKQGTPFIEFDTNNGTVKLGHGTSPTNPGVDVAYDQTIITSDTLKYANISNKPFTVEFLPNDEATVKVVVTVKGFEAVEGLLTKSLLFAQPNAPTESNLYVSIGGLDNSNTATAKMNKWELNFYGYKNYAEGYVPPKITDGLTDIATLEKNAVPFTNGWAPLSDIQDGGVNLKYLALSAGLQYVYNQNIAAVAGPFPGVQGFMLQFDGYVNNNTSAQTDSQASGIFTIVLTRSTADTIPHIKQGTPFIEFDTNNGTVKLGHGTSPTNPGVDVAYDQTIITSDTLKYANISNKPFTVEFLPNDADDTTVKVVVTVKGFEAVEGLLTKSLLFAQPNAPTESNLYVSIGGLDNSNTATAKMNKWELNFYGFKNYAEGYVPPKITDGLTHVATLSDNAVPFDNGWASFKDIQDGGVNLKYLALSTGLQYVYNQDIGAAVGGFPGTKGFMLQFDGYANNNTAAQTESVASGIFTIVLTKATRNYSTHIKQGTPFIEFDTNEGTVKLGHGTSPTNPGVDVAYDQTIITSDTLKYANISGKPFTVEFLPNDADDATVKVVVTVKGFEAVEGLLTKSLLFAQPNAPDNSCFISIGGLDNGNTVSAKQNRWEINFYGYKNYRLIEENTCITGDLAAVNSAIAALPASATLDKAQEILLAKAMYDALSDEDKSKVTDADKLTALITALNTLRNGEKFKATTTFVSKEMDETLGYASYGNNGARTVFSSATDTGFKAEWRGSKYDVLTWTVLTSQGIYGALPLDGLSIYIDGYNFDDAKSSDFYLQFTSGDYTDIWDGTAKMAERMIALHIGAADEKLKVYGVGLDGIWIAGSSDLITRDALKEKGIIVQWFKQANGDYICTLTVGQEVLAFTVSKEKLDNMDGFDENRVRTVIAAPSNKHVFGLEVTGVYAKLDDTVKNVTKQIAELPAKVESDNDVKTIEAVQSAYDALSVAQKEQVLNGNLLVAARGKIRAYEGVDKKGRDPEGFYVPDYTLDVVNNAKDGSFAYTTESEHGGLHMDFTNGAYGLACCVGKSYVLDNLTLRFDNYQYGNDSCIMVGVESEWSNGKIFDYTAGATQRGIYLLIGRNNTIYSTLSNGDYTKTFPLFEPNELLSATNLINKEFFIKYVINPDKTISVIFTVDNTDFKYTYSEEYVENLTYFDTEDIQIVVHTSCGYDPGATPIKRGTNLQSVTLDFTGYNYSEFSATQMGNIQEVIDAIEKLPSKASAQSRDEIMAVWKQFFVLNKEGMRLAVTNHAKLIELYNQLFDMDLLDQVEAEEIPEASVPEDTTVEEDDNASYEEVQGEPEEETETVVIKKKKKKDNAQTQMMVDWLLIAIIAGIVVGLAVITVIIIYAVKRRKIKGEVKVNE